MAKGSAGFLGDVFDAVRAADRDGLLSPQGIDVEDRLSGQKTVGALQRLSGLFAESAGACYLEVGVYQGLTLLAVAVNFPGLPCFGIDDFSLLDPGAKNRGIVRARIARLAAANAALIDEDCEAALERLGEHIGNLRIGVYFVDGAHDYRSQVMGLTLVKPFLHRQAAIVIDDANYAFVRQATRDFLIANPEFKMVFEAYTPAHPANMDPETRKRHEAGWLNGVHVLACDHDGLLPAMLPPTEESRTLYVNEWLVHRHQMAELAPEALALAGAVCRGDADAERAARARLLEKHAGLKGALDSRFPDRNVYSHGLTEGRFNRFFS